MKVILDPMTLETFSEEIDILKKFIKDKLNINVNYFLINDNKLYKPEESTLIPYKELKISDSIINDISLKESLANALNINIEKLHFISFIENTKIVLTFEGNIDSESIYFVEKMISIIMMKNLLNYQINRYDSELQSVKNALFYREFELKTLYRLEKMFYETENLNKLLKDILNYAVKILNADNGSIAILKKGKIHFFRVSPLSPEELLHIELKVGEGLIGKSIELREVIIENDPQSSPFWKKDIAESLGYIPSSIIVSPIFSPKKEILGAVEILNKDKGKKFNKNSKIILTLFCAELGKILPYFNKKYSFEDDRK